MSTGFWSSFHTPYNESEVRKVVPSAGGLYALWVRYQSGKWECYYFGKAANLESRLLDHLNANEPSECIKKNAKYRRGFQWMNVTTEADRSGAEKYLYDNMKTECNQDDPGGSPLKIPLPPTPVPTDHKN